MFGDVDPGVWRAARELLDYHRLGETIGPADGVLVFGSNDLRVAEYAAGLVLEGWAPWVMFSGARGRMTEHWPETEAETMAGVARTLGVSGGKIHMEVRATNTGENIRFSRGLIRELGLRASTLIVVQKPYMERRTRAALEAQWPELDFRVGSPPLDLEACCSGGMDFRSVVECMAGDFQRILDYPALGFATTQPVTERAMAAYRFLLSAGFGGQCRSAGCENR